MRFILLAFALLAAIFYISNPQAFGVKQNFKVSGNGRVERNLTGGANVDFTKIGEFGANLFNDFMETGTDSVEDLQTNAQNGGLINGALPNGALPNERQSLARITATPTPQVQPETADTNILSAIKSSDLTSYDGRLTAIATAMSNDPVTTSAEMNIAMNACLNVETSTVLSSYFVGLVQLVAETSQLPAGQRADNLKVKSQPLNSLLNAWVSSLPKNERSATIQTLQNWAGKPTELVACHMEWLRTAP